MNVRHATLLAAVLLSACAGRMVAPPSPGATYDITVVRTWSEATHPLEWPGRAARFTGGIGATHDDAHAMFGAGRIATPGLETLSQKRHADALRPGTGGCAGPR